MLYAINRLGEKIALKKEDTEPMESPELTRRLFVKTTALAATALPTFRILADTPAEAKIENQVNVAVIGYGAEGTILTDDLLLIPGVRVKAVCDIWKPRRQRAKGILRAKGHKAEVFEDYREMLSAMKGQIDAVVIATPDWMHHTHTIACLEAGLDVYCEKEMSNSLEHAKAMVQAMRRTGRILQIGHQRRSNPRYRHAIDTVIRRNRLLGRVTHAYAQWNRSVAPFVQAPPRHIIDGKTLEKYGYANMEQFLNWRWFSKYGGGPMVDLGSHQIDLFFWIWDALPTSVCAIGGNDYYKREMGDCAQALYEFKCPDGFIGRASYRVLTTSSLGGFYEQFMGDCGSLTLSEVAARGNVVLREPNAPAWDVQARQGLILPVPQTITRTSTTDASVDVRVSRELEGWPLPVELNKPAHLPHLENFFEAVRAKDPKRLTCPADLAYESAVAVLAVNRAIATRQPVLFEPSDFRV